MNTIRFKVRNLYDIQRLRIASSNRTPKKDQKLELLEQDVEYFKDTADGFKKLEKIATNAISAELASNSIWTDFLKDVKGCGIMMAGVIVSELDINKADTISKFWAYSGLGMERQWNIEYKDTSKSKFQKIQVWATSEHNAKAVIPTPKNKKINRKYNHIALVDGDTQSQRLRPKQYPSYNTWLKTKLVGVLAGCFLKSNSPYRKYYDDYKHRKEQQNWGGFLDKKTGLMKSVKGHRDMASKRYMIKMFLKDLWLKWREIEKLPIRPSYQEEYLGHKHA